MSLPQEVQASYVVIIDSILAASDLNTITSKRIREGLQKAVDYDITPHKIAIKALGMARFDKYVAEQKNLLQTNGHSELVKTESPGETSQAIPSIETPPQERTSMNHDGDEKPTNAPVTPPPKKKRKAVLTLDDDAAFAAKLQAEENHRARPTRGGATRKVNTVKKRKTPKKKTSDKVKAEDDSGLGSSGSGVEDKKVNRSGGFHKPLTLSAPLSALLDGEVQLSRPQTVKRIWAYVRARDLQDPKDRRLILCDDALRAVFKQDKVHMCTMNKILKNNLYDPEE